MPLIDEVTRVNIFGEKMYDCRFLSAGSHAHVWNLTPEVKKALLSAIVYQEGLDVATVHNIENIPIRPLAV